MADFAKLFVHVGQAVKHSFLHPEEAGTASCVVTRVFVVNAQRVRLLAAGIGDGLVAVFDPEEGFFKTLIKPRQYDRGGEFTPLSITEKLAENKLQCADIELSTKSLIFRMTDGAWEALPYNVSLPILDTTYKKTYLEYALDEAALCQQLSDFTKDYPQAKAADYRQILQILIQKNIETKKSRLNQQQADIRLQLTAFREAHEGSNRKGVYPLVAVVNSMNYQLVRDFERKLKDEASKQWVNVDANKALAKLNRCMPAALSPNATYVNLGDWYKKEKGKPWCVLYDCICLDEARVDYANLGGGINLVWVWEQTNWETRGDILKKAQGKPRDKGNWWGTNGEGRILFAPSRRVHDSAIK